MSYTDFKFSNLTLNSKSLDKTITATVTITNTGKVTGKEVAQLYITAPSAKLDKPSMELKAFGKTNLLQPGQSQQLTFTISAEDLASFDTDATSWIADAGTYTVKVGSSSASIKQTASFSLAKEVVTQKCIKALAPEVPVIELKRAF